jgi:hypothetical protein
MKQKTCKLCNRNIEHYKIILAKELGLCVICFNFMLSKYGTVNRIKDILKNYRERRLK